MISTMYETDRLILEPFTRKHLDGPYRSWFHDQEVTRWNSHGLFPYTTAQMEAFLAAIEAGDMIVLAVMAKTPMDQKSLPFPNWELHIGNVALQNINWIDRSAEYAVIIGDRSYWSQGYATEAAQLLFEHGFKKLGLHRIWSGAAAPNTGMIMVFEKLGMKREGVLRQNVFLNGQWIDVVIYGILEEEWEECSKT